MARQKTQVEYNNFTGGIITEASPLTFPENASLDEQNVNINRDGSRQRRFGLDWTDDTTVVNNADTSMTFDKAVTSFLWESVNNNGEINFSVVQRGHDIYLFDLDTVDPSANMIYTVDISTVTTVNPSHAFNFSFDTINGNLIIAVGTQYVYRAEWNGSALVFSEYRLKVRDRWGIEDGYTVDQRIGVLTNSRHYNLRNQGWPKQMWCAQTATGTSGVLFADPVVHTNTILGPTGLNLGAGSPYYPSHADLVWACKMTAVAGTNTDNIGAYSPWELDKVAFGSTFAPKGRYIIDLFNRGSGRIAASGFGGLPADATSGSINTVSSFAGRVWYTVNDTGLTSGDDNSPFIGNMLFYSQTSTDFTRWGRCHTDNDPTSDELSDVLETDGGFIQIIGAGEIIKTLPLGESLVVFATNGVWEITGGDTGFSATVQTVVKITDRGAINKLSIVDGETSIVYWTDSGIYLVEINQTTLRLAVNNISRDTIQSFYDEIPLEHKKQATGNWDRIGKQVLWLYNDEDQLHRTFYTKELVLDAGTGAFTKRKFNSVTNVGEYGPFPICHVQIQNVLKNNFTTEEVTVSAVPVTAGGVIVTIPLSFAVQENKTAMLYWVTHSPDAAQENNYLSGYVNFDFVDFSRIPTLASDAEAYILTGYLTGGDSSRYKFSPYVSVKCKRTESSWSIDGSGNVTVVGESSCILQGQWEWTNNANAGRWTTPQQVYRLPRFFLLDSTHTFSFDVVNTRNKLRGKGRALSLKFSSEPLKNMHILGWGQDIAIKGSV